MEKHLQNVTIPNDSLEEIVAIDLTYKTSKLRNKQCT